MNYNRLFVFLWLFQSSFLWAQYDLPRVTLGPVLAFEEYDNLLNQLLPPFEDGSFICYSPGRGFEGSMISDMHIPPHNRGAASILFQRYDADLNQIGSNSVLLKSRKLALSLIEVVLMRDRLYLFVSRWDANQKAFLLERQEIDIQTLELLGDREVLLKMPTRKKKERGTFQVELSPNRSKVLVYGANGYEEGEAYSFFAKVYNRKGDLLWEHTGKAESLHEYKPIKLSNLGVAIIAEPHFKSSDPKKDFRDLNYEVEFTLLEDQGRGERRFVLSKEEGYIRSFEFELSPSGALVFAGVYRDLDRFERKGLFFQVYDLEKERLSVKTVNPFAGNKDETEWENPPDALRYRLVLDRIVFREDGGALLVTQFQRSVANKSQDGSYYATYLYSSLVLASVDQEGKLDWSQKVDFLRKYLGFYKTRAPYNMVLLPDRLVIITERRDSKANQSSVFRKARKSDSLVMISVDPAGNESAPILLFPAGGKGVHTHVYMGIEQIGDKVWLQILTGEKVPQFVKLSF